MAPAGLLQFREQATRSSDSGVVFTAGKTRPARWYSMVPIRAVVLPAARSMESIKYEVVVLPFVPVIPVRTMRSSGRG